MKINPDTIWVLEIVFGALPGFAMFLLSLFALFAGGGLMALAGLMGSIGIFIMVSPARDDIIKKHHDLKIPIITLLIFGIVAVLSFLFIGRNNLGINLLTLIFIGPLVVALHQVYLLMSYSRNLTNRSSRV